VKEPRGETRGAFSFPADLQKYGKQGKAKMDMTEALLAHCEWKDRLYQAIANREEVDRDLIASDCNCQFGKWMHGEGESRYQDQPHFRTCLGAHADFHAQAGTVADALNAGNYDQAMKMLAAGSAYAQASQALSLQVIAFNKEIQAAAK
jgi:hypothetical protein